MKRALNLLIPGLLLAVLVSVATPWSLQAQPKTDGKLSGTVLDTAGEPLPGAIVILKSGGRGSATKVSGHSIRCVKD